MLYDVNIGIVFLGNLEFGERIYVVMIVIMVYKYFIFRVGKSVWWIVIIVVGKYYISIVE